MVQRKFLANTWVELSEKAYANNLSFFKGILGSRPELSVVVKANAYGHGWQSMARMAIKHGVDSFCVHSLEEAMRLRNAGFTQNILIMGHIPLNLLTEAVRHHFRIGVFNRETVECLHEITEKLQLISRIHLKLETGTYRHGVDQDELPWYLEKLKHSPRVMLEAVYTHFANVEDTTTYDYANYQQYCFNKLVQMVQENGFPILKKHTACTAAALLFQDTHMDMVRIGIGQYGFWPSRETLISYREKYNVNPGEALRPVLSWKTSVTQIKPVPADKAIGYGRTFKTMRNTTIAVLPVGYSDGYNRKISNQGYVLVKGRRAPIRGRICMNLMMVDVTDIADVQLEDEVVLIGRQGDEMITAGQLAEWCDTIPYEVIAAINPNIKRMVVDEMPEVDEPDL